MRLIRSDYVIMAIIVMVWLGFPLFFLYQGWREKKKGSPLPAQLSLTLAREKKERAALSSPETRLAIVFFLVLNVILYVGVDGWIGGWNLWKHLVLVLLMSPPLIITSFGLASMFHRR